MAHATKRLKVIIPKKHVVRFDYYDKDVARDDQEPQLLTSIYINKECAKEELGIKNLAKVKGIEVTIRVLK